jgi:hypothetical protein
MTNKITSAMFDDEQRKIAVNLFRYTLWANSMMGNFEKVLSRDYAEMKRQLEEGKLTFDVKRLESEMYHCLWFGILYIVIEGWPSLRIKNQKITKLLRSPYKKLLQNFRNATFHPEDYDDARIQVLVVKGRESIDWARKVTLEFKSFFESILFIP